MAVCVHNLLLIIILMLSPLRNESGNENKINQNSSVSIRVISYISSIYIIKICLKDWEFLFFFLLKSTKFVLIYVLYMFKQILVI